MKTFKVKFDGSMEVEAETRAEAVNEAKEILRFELQRQNFFNLDFEADPVEEPTS